MLESIFEPSSVSACVSLAPVESDFEKIPESLNESVLVEPIYKPVNYTPYNTIYPSVEVLPKKTKPVPFINSLFKPFKMSFR